MTISVEGKNLSALDRESGVNRLQRVPPTERSGRVHTSSVTVAVLDESGMANGRFDRSDQNFSIEWFNGTIGAGGQHRNKTATSIRLKFVPTGLIKTAQGRSREANKRDAFAAMNAALDALETGHASRARNGQRRTQIGDGGRAAERKRTFRFQDGQVIDHETGRTAKTSVVMKGGIDALWIG